MRFNTCLADPPDFCNGLSKSLVNPSPEPRYLVRSVGLLTFVFEGIMGRLALALEPGAAIGTSAKKESPSTFPVVLVVVLVVVVLVLVVDG